MMSSGSLYRHFKIWILPAFFLFAAISAFLFWAEDQINLPGSFRDVEYWEAAMAPASAAADLMPLSGYLHQRVAEMMAEPKRNYDALMTFGWMDNVFQNAQPLRKIPDLKYGLDVYKKQMFLAAPSALKFYLSLRHYWGAGKQNIKEVHDVVLESDQQIEKLLHLKKMEAQGDIQAVRAAYENLLNDSELLNLQAPLMLRFAFFLYEKYPSEAHQWIDRLKKKKPSPVVYYAAVYLRNKLSQRAILSKKNFKSAETETESCFKMGLLERAVHKLDSDKKLLFSNRMNEMQVWLGAKETPILDLKQSFLSMYFSILQDALKTPAIISDQLMKLAVDTQSAAFSALLRYQAWGLAYFDAKDYSRAFFISEFLEEHDPLSAYSRIEAIKGLFRRPTKSFTGSRLLQIWQAEPYRFEWVRKDNWVGFKGGKKRMSQTIVHEGRVYVVNYDETGKAEKLQEVGEGESVSTQRETLEASQAPEEMGWMDQFFYGMMMKFIPLGVRTFKRQIWKPAQNIKKPIFTHFYKQDDFQEHILNTMLPVLGSNVQTLQAQIDEQGFHVYSIFNFKFISVTVLGLGKLLANEDGQLILKLDHVKVGKIYLPKWLLKRVEKNFNLAAYSEESSEEVPIDILSMQYQAGGISIRCRKNLFQATAVAQG